MAKSADPRSVGEALLALSLSRPQDAIVRAEELLATSDDPLRRSYALQAQGIVLRDDGRTSEAIARLQSALVHAGRSASLDRVADVRATLGVALVVHGRIPRGLEELRRAAVDARGEARARVQMRRALVLWSLGRFEEAMLDVQEALRRFRRSDDQLWEARTLNLRCLLHIAGGAVVAAQRDLTRAIELFDRSGQDLEMVRAVHNAGALAYLAGDLPRALRLYDEALAGHRRLQADAGDVLADRCEALLAAGLVQEMASLVNSPVHDPRRPSKQAPHLQLMLARAMLASDQPHRALELARGAETLFRRRHTEAYTVQAQLVAAVATFQLRSRQRGLVAKAVAIGGVLDGRASEEAPVAWTLAGRAALAVGQPADELFAAAARYRSMGPALVRARGWLAEAIRAEAAGEDRRTFHACRRGFDALDEHQQTLGSTELRAMATVHGRELAEIAVRLAVKRKDARALLTWCERSRTTAATTLLARPPQDERSAADLVAMRDVVRRLDDARRDGSPTEVLSWERARLERSIRERSRHHSADATRERRASVGELLGRLDGITFVELVNVDEVLHAVVCHGGTVRRFEVGPLADAQRAVEQAAFTLRQAAHGRPARLGPVGSRLERTLLGRARLGDGPVVVSPPSSLHAAPWALLPSLGARPVSVVPSANAWLHALDDHRRSAGVILVGGPGLDAKDVELRGLAEELPGSTILDGDQASVGSVLAAIDGAALAHVVAHGQFRADSPTFSSLLLADGPLTVHDLEGLRRPPARMILAACESGVMAPVGSDALLGLASALLAIGTRGLVTSVAEVNDAATAAVMLDVHRSLAAHDDLATALLHAREAAAGDPLAEATAASFLALGV